MNPAVALALSLLVAPDPSDRVTEPVTEIREEAKSKTSILEHKGLPKLIPMPGPTAGVFAGKLKRGRKAKLSVLKPAAKGVGLMVTGGASSIPLYMYVDPGIYITPDNGAVAIVLAPGPMQGDTLRATCTGDLPPALDLGVLHRAPSGTNLVSTKRLRVGKDTVTFTIPTAGLNDGILLASLTTPKGQARLDTCVVKRLKP